MANSEPMVSAPAASGSAKPFIDWARANSVPIASVEPGRGFGDLAPLQEIVQGASVVAFGENGHGVHEFLAFRTRLFQFLVQQMGFTALAVESGFPASILADRYVLGEDVPVSEAAQSIFAWCPDPLAQNVELIQWIRRHNASPGTSRKIRVYGIDVQGGEVGRFVHSRRAIDAALAYLRGADAGLAESLGEPLRPFLDRFNDAEYHRLTTRERNDLTAAIADLVGALERERLEFLASTPAVEYRRAYHSAVSARQVDSLLRASPYGKQIGSGAPPDSFSRSIRIRDATMFGNLMWVLEREGPRGRVLVFAQNWHVKKAREFQTGWPEYFPGDPVPSLGEHLAPELGDQLVVIGSAFARGPEGAQAPASDPASIDSALAAVGVPAYVLDLRRAPDTGPLAAWLGKRTKMWHAADATSGNYWVVQARNAFDAIVFVDQVSEAAIVGQS